MENKELNNNSIYNNYSNPLIERYASKEMSYIFSPYFKFYTWRKLWVRLAEGQKFQGLNISEKQINEMKQNIKNIDFEYAKEKEKELRHDVMAHIKTFAKQCPTAAPIIHLGATSCFVGDNTELIQIKEALKIVEKKIVLVLEHLKGFSLKYYDLPTLAYTHFQPAQLTTVGKRSALWMQELIFDLEKLNFIEKNLAFRGLKGTTGTQASFYYLFNKNSKKVKELNDYVTKESGFSKSQFISGQTYSRKIDYEVASLLSSIAQSCSKFANDLRMLQNKKEIEEPFEKNQVGSSAMAYKRNPMRCERINSLTRFVMTLTESFSYTASTQWFERTLDDSANKRLSLPQSFLAIDSILDLYRDVSENMIVYPRIIEKHVKEELPFMITENLIMEGVKKGGNRQKLHEIIRQLSMEAAKEVKENGKNNNLTDLLLQEGSFPLQEEELTKLLNPQEYIGRSSELTIEFIEEIVTPLITSINKNNSFSPNEVDLKV